MLPLLLLQQAIRQKAPAKTPLEKLADRLSPALRRRFLVAVQSIKDRIDLDALARAVQAGSVTQAEFAVRMQKWPELYGELAADLKAGFVAGAHLAEAQFVTAEISISFDMINVHAVRYSMVHIPKLAEFFKEDGREAIRSIITESLSGKYTVQQAAQQIRGSIGLTSQYTKAVMNLESQLLADGVSAERIKKQVEAYRAKLLRSRATTIARTEITNAAKVGRRAGWDEAAVNGLFNKQTATRRWVTNHEGETNRGNPTPCILCDPMDGQEIPYGGIYHHPILGGVDIFGEPLVYPSLHPNCLCHEELIL